MPTTCVQSVTTNVKGLAVLATHLSKKVSYDIYQRRQNRKTPQRRRVMFMTVGKDDSSDATRTCSVIGCRRAEQTADCTTQST